MDKAEKEKILDELGGVSEADYDTLVAELIGQLEEQVIELAAAANRDNFEAIARIAHTIKGASGNLRVYKIQETAKSLESAAKDKQSKTEIAAALGVLGQELAELKRGMH